VRELIERKKLQILRLFFEGYSYDDISSKSDVALGKHVPRHVAFRSTLQEFTAAALKLFRLSRETGESYNSVAAKWSELYAECESLEQEVEDLKSANEELETRWATLTDECQMLEEEVERLDALGFGKSELETLRVKLDELASGHGLTSEQLMVRFFDDLASEALRYLEEEEAERTKVVEVLQAEEAGIKATIFRPPTWVVRKYYSISEYTQVELAGLVRWSLEAFTEGVGENE